MLEPRAPLTENNSLSSTAPSKPCGSRLCRERRPLAQGPRAVSSPRRLGRGGRRGPAGAHPAGGALPRRGWRRSLGAAAEPRSGAGRCCRRSFAWPPPSRACHIGTAVPRGRFPERSGARAQRGEMEPPCCRRRRPPGLALRQGRCCRCRNGQSGPAAV